MVFSGKEVLRRVLWKDNIAVRSFKRSFDYFPFAGLHHDQFPFLSGRPPQEPWHWMGRRIRTPVHWNCRYKTFCLSSLYLSFSLSPSKLSRDFAILCFTLIFTPGIWPGSHWPGLGGQGYVGVGGGGGPLEIGTVSYLDLNWMWGMRRIVLVTSQTRRNLLFNPIPIGLDSYSNFSSNRAESKMNLTVIANFTFFKVHFFKKIYKNLITYIYP